MEDIKYNKDTEPIQGIIDAVNEAEENNNLPLTLQFNSSNKAEYVKGRYYKVRKSLKQEASKACIPGPTFLIVSQKDDTLTFRERKGVAFEIVS